MKRKALILTLLLMTIVVYSCKKEDKEEPITPTPTTVYPNYSQLKVGNYWIYQQFELDSMGNETPKNIFDSCYVEKDTVINSHTYYKLISPYDGIGSGCKYIRDSLHYIVSAYNGQILFSSQDFTSTLYSGYSQIGAPNSDTIWTLIAKMDDKNRSVTTPAGTFITSNMKEKISFNPNFQSSYRIRYRNNRYAENIGLVVETLPIWSAQLFTVERRLVRYHIN